MTGTAKTRQCQSCFHVLPAQSPCPQLPEGRGALPTLAPFLEAGLELSNLGRAVYLLV